MDLSERFREAATIVQYRWYYFVVLACTSWNLLLVTVVAFFGVSVVRIGGVGSAPGIPIAFYFIISFFIWLVCGLAKRNYLAMTFSWCVSAGIGWRGMFLWIGFLIGGHPEYIFLLPQSFLGLILLIATPLNLVMFLLLPIYQDDYYPPAD